MDKFGPNGKDFKAPKPKRFRQRKIRIEQPSTEPSSNKVNLRHNSNYNTTKLPEKEKEIDAIEEGRIEPEKDKESNVIDNEGINKIIVDNFIDMIFSAAEKRVNPKFIDIANSAIATIKEKVNRAGYKVTADAIRNLNPSVVDSIQNAQGKYWYQAVTTASLEIFSFIPFKDAFYDVTDEVEEWDDL